MPEKETIFSSKISYNGIFSFKDFYKFCYDWLKEEMGLNVSENSYSEKIEGATKNINVGWNGERKITDYFKMEVNVSLKANGLKEAEIQQGNAKIKTNQGSVEVSIKGTLINDYEGKFETTAFKKFLRGIYEKWVVPASIEEHKTNISESCDGFLNQAKAYLDLEGRKE